MNTKISLEDVLLYTIVASVFLYLGFYFVRISDDLNRQIIKNRTAIEQYDHSVAMTQTILRYDFGNNVLVSNSARVNMSFMIGSVIAVLGALIVIRRVKTEANIVSGEAKQFKFNFSSNSPGLTVSLFGGIIICLSIVLKDKYTMSDTAGPSQSRPHLKPNPDKNKIREIMDALPEINAKKNP